MGLDTNDGAIYGIFLHTREQTKNALYPWWHRNANSMIQASHKYIGITMNEIVWQTQVEDNDEVKIELTAWRVACVPCGWSVLWRDLIAPPLIGVGGTTHAPSWLSLLQGRAAHHNVKAVDCRKYKPQSKTCQEWDSYDWTQYTMCVSMTMGRMMG